MKTGYLIAMAVVVIGFMLFVSQYISTGWLIYIGVLLLIALVAGLMLPNFKKEGK
jgi:hypothetical protein